MDFFFRNSSVFELFLNLYRIIIKWKTLQKGEDFWYEAHTNRNKKKQPRTILTDDFRGSVSINEEEKKVLLDVIKVKLF